MIKSLWMITLLALAGLLSACGITTTVNVPPAVDVIDVPAVQLDAGTAEKVVTLVPEAEAGLPDAPEPERSSGPDEKMLEAAGANVNALLNSGATGAPQVELDYRGMDRIPNATNHKAMLFVDLQGNSYYVREDTLQPVEFTLAHPLQESLGSPLTADELRAAAEQIATSQSTRFDRWKDKLVYTEGVKGENNFFRWEAPDIDVGGMPAMLQISLRQDGSLFSYVNSLDFLP